MADHLTAEQRFKAMSRVKHRDGPLEVAVRSALHVKGYRFRKHVRNLPGSPDIVFSKNKLAVFIDGDFWHGYRYPKWRHKLSKFWQDKIETNRRRDKRNFQKLRRMGWKVIRIWEHQIKTDLEGVVNKITNAMNSNECK